MFDPDSVSVKVGETVTFKNNDDFAHNIQITPKGGDAEDQGLQKPGHDITSTFSNPGPYNVSCSLHPNMKMTVWVQK
jgi:cytochrome c peroxidase